MIIINPGTEPREGTEANAHDPDLTQKGEPWVSPRIYVDGSSWLWGIGLSVFGPDDT